MLNVTYSRCMVLIYIAHLFWFDSSKALIKTVKIKVAYNKHNSASEMFVNMNTLLYGELLKIKSVLKDFNLVIRSNNNLLIGIVNCTTHNIVPFGLGGMGIPLEEVNMSFPQAKFSVKTFKCIII